MLDDESRIAALPVAPPALLRIGRPPSGGHARVRLWLLLPVRFSSVAAISMHV